MVAGVAGDCCVGLSRTGDSGWTGCFTDGFVALVWSSADCSPCAETDCEGFSGS